MKIIETFQKSLYNPAFYRGVGEMSLKDALRAYIIMMMVFTVFATVASAAILVPRASRFLHEGAGKLIQQYYPANLEVHIEKGVASINSPEPYFIPGRRSTLDTLSTDVSLENILVIDTRSDFGKAQFDDYKTFALLTQHEIVTRGERGTITIQDLKSFPEATINAEMLLRLVERVSAWYPLIALAGVVGLFGILFAGYLFYLIPLLVFALIPLCIAWMKGTPLRYSAAYKMSLYAVIPGLAFKTLLNMGGYFSIPAYLSFLIFVLVIVVNMQAEKNIPRA